MVSYNYIRIFIRFQLLFQLLVDRKIIHTTDHYYVPFNIVLVNLIICGARLIQSQVIE